MQNAFYQAKRMLSNGTLENQQALISRFVKSVTIFPDQIEIQLNIVGGFVITETIMREAQ